MGSFHQDCIFDMNFLKYLDSSLANMTHYTSFSTSTSSHVYHSIPIHCFLHQLSKQRTLFFESQLSLNGKKRRNKKIKFFKIQLLLQILKTIDTKKKRFLKLIFFSHVHFLICFACALLSFLHVQLIISSTCTSNHIHIFLPFFGGHTSIGHLANKTYIL